MVDIEALKNFEIFKDLDHRELEHVATYARAQVVVISRRLKARESELIKALDRQ